MTPEPTERLRFRCWHESDGPLAEALWCDPEVTRYFGGAMTPEQARARLSTEIERERSLGMQYWPIFELTTGAFAGCAGLRPLQSDRDQVEAGVHIMRAFWGLRLGEESLRAVLTFGFESMSLPEIVAGHGVENENSRKLLQRVGFRYTHNTLWGPKELPVSMYSMNAAGWLLEEPA